MLGTRLEEMQAAPLASLVVELGHVIDQIRWRSALLEEQKVIRDRIARVVARRLSEEIPDRSITVDGFTYTTDVVGQALAVGPISVTQGVAHA